MKNDFVELFSIEFGVLAKFKEISNYNNYLFSLNVFKMQSIVKDILLTSKGNFIAFCSSLDLFLQNVFREYEKRILFVYNSLYLELKNDIVFNNSKISPILSVSNINIYQKDTLLISDTIKNDLKISYCFEILISLYYCINKFKELNFFHKVKYRPIGNVKYIFLDDSHIINKFSSIS